MASLEPQSPEYLDKELIQTALENYFCCNEVQINEFQLSTLVSGSGENYCSDIYEIKVKHQLMDSGEKEQQDSFVIKSMPKHKQLILRNLKIYNRELYFYKNILPKIETLMKVKEKEFMLGPR